MPNAWRNNGGIMTAAASSAWTLMPDSIFQDFSQWNQWINESMKPMKRRNRNQDTMSSRRISHVQNTLIRWRECLCWRGGKTLQQWRGSTGPAGRGEQPEEAWKRLGRAGGRNKLCLPLPAVQRHQRPDTLQGFFLKLPNKLFWLF